MSASTDNVTATKTTATQPTAAGTASPSATSAGNANVSSGALLFVVVSLVVFVASWLYVMVRTLIIHTVLLVALLYAKLPPPFFLKRPLNYFCCTFFLEQKKGTRKKNDWEHQKEIQRQHSSRPRGFVVIIVTTGVYRVIFSGLNLFHDKVGYKIIISSTAQIRCF